MIKQKEFNCLTNQVSELATDVKWIRGEIEGTNGKIGLIAKVEANTRSRYITLGIGLCIMFIGSGILIKLL